MDVIDSLSTSVVRMDWIGLLGKTEMRRWHLWEGVLQSEI